jgi:hypothetical protein
VRASRSCRSAATLLALVVVLFGARSDVPAQRGAARTTPDAGKATASQTLAATHAGLAQPFIAGSAAAAAELVVDESMRSAGRAARARAVSQRASSLQLAAERARSRAHAAALAYLAIRPDLARAITGGPSGLGTNRPPPRS